MGNWADKNMTTTTKSKLKRFSKKTTSQLILNWCAPVKLVDVNQSLVDNLKNEK